MAKMSPLQQVNQTHGSKEKLVDKLVDLVDRSDEDKATFRDRLKAAPNSKLLRLFTVSTEVKERFGTKADLVSAVLDLQKRGNDGDYRQKLLSHTPAKLLGMHRDLAKSNA